MIQIKSFSLKQSGKSGNIKYFIITITLKEVFNQNKNNKQNHQPQQLKKKRTINKSTGDEANEIKFNRRKRNIKISKQVKD